MALNLTGWENASQQLARFANFLVSENKRYMSTRFVPNDAGHKRLSLFVDQHAMKLKGDLDAAHHDVLAWLATASFQLQGVLNLISQQGAHISIQIATETKRDSSSIAAIALVTMLFLLGMFVSAFHLLLGLFRAYTLENFRQWSTNSCFLDIPPLTVPRKHDQG